MPDKEKLVDLFVSERQETLQFYPEKANPLDLQLIDSKSDKS
jgi:hypothetical protein